MSKYRPVTREEFKALCLRNLGDGMIEVNVTDDQIEDAIEEGLKFFRDYHYDGSKHVYYMHQITPTDITNRYITIPENIFGVVDVYDYRRRGMYGLSSTDMFSYDYQLIHQQSSLMENGSILSYYLNRTAYETISQIIGNQSPLRFNRHDNRVYIDSDWNRYNAGEFIVLDAYEAVDPDVNTDIWNDRWLVKYVSAKIKFKFGQNLWKFEGVPLPGGITLNGTAIKDEATNEIQALEDEMQSSYSIPARDMTG